jgi:hypothetical protein
MQDLNIWACHVVIKLSHCCWRRGSLAYSLTRAIRVDLILLLYRMAAMGYGFWDVRKQWGNDKRGEGVDDPLLVDGLVERLGNPGDCNKFATNILLSLR